MHGAIRSNRGVVGLGMPLTPRTQYKYVFGETPGNDTAVGGKMPALQGMRRSSSAVGPNERSRSGRGDGQGGPIEGANETRRCFHQWAPHPSHQEPQEPPYLEANKSSAAPSKVRANIGRVCFIPSNARTWASSILPRWCLVLLFRTSVNDFWAPILYQSVINFQQIYNNITRIL